MGVNQKPLNHGKRGQQIGKNVKPSGKVVGNAIPTQILDLRESDANPDADAEPCKGAKIGDHNTEETSLFVHRRKRPRGTATDIDETEDLSDIADVEVSSYLLKEDERQYKKIIWEALNRNHMKVKKPKEEIQKKRDLSVKRAVKTTKKVENKTIPHTQRPSSRINYEALAALDNELIEGLVHDGDEKSRDPSFKMQEAPESNYGESQHNFEGYENNGMYGEPDGDMYYEDG